MKTQKDKTLNSLLIFILFAIVQCGFGQNVQTFLNEADSAEKNSNYKKAIKCYKKAIKLDPNSADAFLGLGDCKRMLRKHNSAIKYYDRSIAINSKNEIAFNHRGFSKMSLQKYSDALEDFSKAIGIDSTYWGFYSNRGDAKTELNNFQSAIDDYVKAKELSPPSSDLGDIYYAIALNKIKLGDKIDACRWLNLADKLGNTSAKDEIKNTCH